MFFLLRNTFHPALTIGILPIPQMLAFVFSFLKSCLLILEREKRGEREGSVASHMRPDWESDPQSRYVP